MEGVAWKVLATSEQMGVHEERGRRRLLKIHNEAREEGVEVGHGWGGVT